MPPRQQAYTVERLQEAAKTAETKAKEYVVSKKWDGVTIACRWLRTCMVYHNGGAVTERRPNVVSPSVLKAFFCAECNASIVIAPTGMLPRARQQS